MKPSADVKGQGHMAENREKSDSAPVVALPLGGRLVPMKVVAEKRKDAIPERKYTFELPPDPSRALRLMPQ